MSIVLRHWNCDTIVTLLSEGLSIFSYQPCVELEEVHSVTDFTLSTTFGHMTYCLIWQGALPSQRFDVPDALMCLICSPT
jgi:hypothetical protein